MVITSLFKEESASESFLSEYGPETRIIWFWIHETNRLTDGYVALNPDGTSRVSITWTSTGSASDIANRARYEADHRRDGVGLSAWDEDQQSSMLTALGITAENISAEEAFAEFALAPIRALERSSTHQLSIAWDAEEDDIQEAIGLRYLVVQKAEAILNDAGLLVDPQGTVVDSDTLSATMGVKEFNTAKSLLWEKLSPEERRYNCRIVSA